MTESANRGYCFNCGDRVDDDDWEAVGCREIVWVCSKGSCMQQLELLQREAWEDRRHDDYDDRW